MWLRVTCGYLSLYAILWIIKPRGTPRLFGVQRTLGVLIIHLIHIIICLTKNNGIAGCRAHLRREQLFVLVQRRGLLNQCDTLRRSISASGRGGGVMG